MKKRKGLKIFSVFIMLVIILVFGTTIVSHVVYKRSLMGTIVESYICISGTKEKFEDTDKYKAFMEERKIENEAAYEIPKSVDFDVKVDESDYQGMQTFYLNENENADCIIIYLHGGAYVNQPSSYHWELCNNIAKETGAEIILPIYPKAPVHTYEETYTLIESLYQDILEKHGDSKIIIMGDSAGGGLAVGICESFAEKDIKQPDELIVFSPWLDISMENPNIKGYESADPMLASYGLIEMGKSWAGDLDIHDYHVSPINGDVTKLHNVTMFVGTREIFYPDIKAFYNKLESVGVTCSLTIGEGMNHVYPMYPIPEAKEAFQAICKTIER